MLALWALDLPAGESLVAFEVLAAVGTLEFEFAHTLFRFSTADAREDALPGGRGQGNMCGGLLLTIGAGAG